MAGAVCQAGVITSLRWTVHADSYSGQRKSPHDEESQLLPKHIDRMQAAARALDFPDVMTLLDSYDLPQMLQNSINEAIDSLPSANSTTVSSSTASPDQDTRIYKVRIVIQRRGEMSIQPNLIQTISGELPVPEPLKLPLQLPTSFDSDSALCVVYPDTDATVPSVLTSHKTTQRQVYDAARLRAHIADKPLMKAEVLLWNERCEVMETSFCTVYFYRNGWTTPAVVSGGNLGVTRRIALEGGFCKEMVLHVKDIIDGELIWLSNAVRGFFQGRISLKLVASNGHQ